WSGWGHRRGCMWTRSLAGSWSYECLKRRNRYVNKATMATLAETTVSAGIQNKATLNGLLPSLLAAKKTAKNRIARIQNRKEKRLSTEAPATAASPVAFVLVVRTHLTPGTSSARITATSPLN